ncbi:MAG: hypothetical protein A2W19_11240 [Spirochaetes bacterium RBG_16_49_21]|nr:MAG: hypothetical protein A2W19_11240 [Spirochaetes bacterium RBG_16_49_21]
MIAASLIAFAVPVKVRAEEVTLSCYKIESGRVVLYLADAVKIIPISGTIEQTWLGDDGLYYVATREESSAVIAYIGWIDPGSLELPAERKLPVEMKDVSIRRLCIKEDNAYLLCRSKTSSEGGGTLYRISMQTLEVSQTPGVFDLYASGQDIVMIMDTGSGRSVVLGGITVSLTISGDLKLQNFVDGRLVFVTNGEETEIIDIRTGKGLHQYSSKYEYMPPGEYDFIVQVTDELPLESGNRDMVLYKVFINGVESGRTDTGPAGVVKEFRNMLEPDHEYVVQLERWELNIAKGRYERVNNILQPKTCKVAIPLNRVIKLMVTFNGKDYTYNLLPVYR